ncbi:MAG: hypothetical protein QXH03_09585 [Candidatus Bathyarchaeia archaeon]
MKRYGWLLSFLVAVGSAIFGLFLGEWLEIISAPLFSTETRAILTGLIIVALLAVITLIAILFFAQRAEEREQKWLQIEERLGIPAEVVFEPIDVGTGKFYRRLSDYIRKVAPDGEIVVMAHYGPRGGEENPRETEQYRQSRQEYSRTLLEKAKEPGITYRRIICFDEGPEQGKIRVGRVKEWVVEHAKQMLEIQKTKPGKVTLKKGKVIFGSDIFIIRGKVAAISLDVRDPEGRVHTDGVLIFHNPPNGDIIQQLYDLFMMVDSQSVPVNRVPEE